MHFNISLANSSRSPGVDASVADPRAALLELVVTVVIYLVSRVPQMVDFAKSLFSLPSDWPVRAFPVWNAYLETYRYTVLSISAVVFFGPILFALPLVVVQDLMVYLIFNLLSLFHGLVPVSSIVNYYSSTSNVIEVPLLPGFLRHMIGTLFRLLEWLSSVYNEATTRHMSLLIFRVLCAAVGVYVLVRIWLTGW
ncbi:hypothetical protein VKT23_007980 [Stygiomarasmius scandens]|uniref:Uncharacterized protein n=1 Tax=Marasmiellus scandens TaxID=2682957 RepID=A0ABR1JPE6_9AGAR